MMMSLLNPDYFCPIHGEPYMRHANKKVAMSLGYEDDKVLLPENGQIIEVYDDRNAKVDGGDGADRIFLTRVSDGAKNKLLDFLYVSHASGQRC